LLVARDDRQSGNRPCGFAIVRTVLDEAELLLIAVAAGCQRQGVGSKLLAGICQMVRAQGVHSLHVEVRHDNLALSFYNYHDFLKVGERANYYHRTDGQFGTALTMVRKITPSPKNRVE
jgi:ribosomal-protein-alanine N-acetyltransferase